MTVIVAVDVVVAVMLLLLLMTVITKASLLGGPFRERHVVYANEVNRRLVAERSFLRPNLT
jgi:hypothetical protein